MKQIYLFLIIIIVIILTIISVLLLHKNEKFIITDFRNTGTNLSYNLKSWMNDLSSIVGNRSLNQIVLPGIHDSMTGKGCKYMDSYCRTQNLDYYQLLLKGARYFDVRIGEKFQNCSDCKYYTPDDISCITNCSSISGNNVYPSFNKNYSNVLGYHGIIDTYENLSDLSIVLNRFISENPNELIIIRLENKPKDIPDNLILEGGKMLINSFFNAVGMDKFVKLKDVLGTSVTTGTFPTYNQILKMGSGRILCFYAIVGYVPPVTDKNNINIIFKPRLLNIKDTINESWNDYLYPVTQGSNIWFWDAAYSTQNTSAIDVYNFLKTNYTSYKPPSKTITVMQNITMWKYPTFLSIINNSKDINQQMNDKYLSLIQPPIGRQYHNIIMTDVIEYPTGYVNKIIELNNV